jgi:hypothetical protein
MAEETMTVVTDDLEKAEGKRVEGAEPFHFAIEGQQYRVDLVPANRAEFLDMLKPFLDVARPVKKGSSKGGAKPRTDAPATAKKSSPKNNDAVLIREWAVGQGIPVSERGRIPNEVVTAYYAGHEKSAP